jgi:hypothetical protein
MGNFSGGSAPSMANQLMEGYIMLSPPMMKRLSPSELRELKMELVKLQREVRAQRVPLDDSLATRQKNHRLQKISSALMVLSNYIQKSSRSTR